jgi:hypothetical protein
MPTLDRPIVGVKLNGPPRPSRRYGSARVCEAAGCDTFLSSYNPGRRCWVHQPMRYPGYSGGNRTTQPSQAYVGARSFQDCS